MTRAVRGPRARAFLLAIVGLSWVVLGSLGFLAVAWRPVLGESVPTLSSQVTDTTGVLAPDRARIDAALSQLFSKAGVQLWVVFVHNTGGTDPSAYVDQIARQNSLGVNDAVLLVALDDRTDQIWVSDGLPQITNAEIDTVISRDLEPNLVAGKYGDAVVATAQGLQDAALGATAAQPGETPAGGLSLTPIVGILLVLAGAWVVWRGFAGWRANRRVAEERDRETGQLARDANAKLIAADDAVRDAQQDLAFAEAQFGADEVAPLRAAIESAKGELTAAFAIRQKLDDDIPEDAQTRAAMLREVAARSDRATATLGAEAKRIEDLRRIEREAPSLIPTLASKADDLDGRITAARVDLDALGKYADAVSAPVRGNLVEASKRVATARAAGTAASTALAGGDSTGAGRNARLAYEALTDADRLVTAIQRARTSVEQDAQAAPGELTAARAELSQAAAGAPADPRVKQADALLAQAASALAAPRPDPSAARRAIASAHGLAEAVDESVRVAAQQRAAAAESAAQAVQRAALIVDQAEDFVATRRVAIDRLARTQLATATDRIAQAQSLLPTDPARAQALASEAARYAQAALSAAQADVTRYDRSGGWGRPTTTGDVLGAALPWILPWIIRGGSGWGGGSWGSPGSGPFGGGGGPFGGGGGGGLPGGFGGGRSRGGRW